jgi:hypothetical protein
MSKNNYLIFGNAKYVSDWSAAPPVKINGSIKVFITKKGSIDKRTKEYKLLMKNKPQSYFTGIVGEVAISKQ